MSKRDATTRVLSTLEKRLDSQGLFWAREVTFDATTDNERRIDYVGFSPFRPDRVDIPASAELGTFECFEVKSCMADFTSGHGLTFYGDRNWLVCPRALAEQLHRERRMPRNIDGVLVPDKPRRRLVSLYVVDRYSLYSHRCRCASELLWAICRTKWSGGTSGTSSRLGLRPVEVPCSYPGCRKVKGKTDGGWMHEADGTDWCPDHWEFDSDGWQRPATWFEDKTKEVKQ